MIARLVDGFDREQRAAAIAEDGERTGRGVTTHHRRVVTIGDAYDLQFLIALIAPEPRHRRVRRAALAGDAVCHRLALIVGVLH